MATLTPPTIFTSVVPAGTLADLMQGLGNVPLFRVLARPAPGTATEHDLLETHDRDNRLVELVDGVLVEKGMGFRESLVAIVLAELLRLFVRPRRLGIVTGADGMMRLNPGLVRIPDVAFVSWERLPDRRVPDACIPDLAPDLAIEVLSESNTPAEMARKRREYFEAGVRLVWLVEHVSRTVTVFTSVDDFRSYNETDNLDGGNVLPGLSFSVRSIFAELDEHGL